MEIRFLRDFRGELTNERFFRIGERANLSNGEALRLVEEGVCELVTQESKPHPAPSVGQRGKRAHK